MKFVRGNIRAIILVLFVMLSEVIYLPLSGIIHHYNISFELINNNGLFLPEAKYYGVSWGVVLYHFFAQIGYISFLPSIFLYKIEKNKDSKGIYLGIILWNILEVLQELNTLLKLNIDFLNKTSSCESDILQIIFITFVVCLGYITHKKWFT